MSAKVASAIVVSALVRRVNAEGGNAAIMAKGDPVSGAIMLICCDKGILQSVRERVLGHDGAYAWIAVGPTEETELSAYLQRRRDRDPDLWLVELDVANAERLAADMA